MHRADHVEVDWVRAQDEGLAHVGELYVVDARRSRLVSRRMHDDHRAVLVVGRGFGVTLVLDVPGEKAHFGAHLDGIFAKGLHAGVVLVQQRLCKSDHWVRVCTSDGGNGSLLCVAP